MKQIFKLFCVEIERLFWLIMIVGVVVMGWILLITESIDNSTFYLALCLITGFGYIASLIKKTKKEELSKNIKNLLVENKDSGSPLGLEPSLDDLNKILKDAGPLISAIEKNMKQSKHFRNQKNNIKKILN